MIIAREIGAGAGVVVVGARPFRPSPGAGFPLRGRVSGSLPTVLGKTDRARRSASGRPAVSSSSLPIRGRGGGGFRRALLSAPQRSSTANWLMRGVLRTAAGVRRLGSDGPADLLSVRWGKTARRPSCKMRVAATKFGRGSPRLRPRCRGTGLTSNRRFGGVGERGHRQMRDEDRGGPAGAKFGRVDPWCWLFVVPVLLSSLLFFFGGVPLAGVLVVLVTIGVAVLDAWLNRPRPALARPHPQQPRSSSRAQPRRVAPRQPGAGRPGRPEADRGRAPARQGRPAGRPDARSRR